MTYTETTTTGYGSRLKRSVKGIIAGIIFVVGATILLFCNEGRSVKTSDTIKEVQGNTELVDDVSVVSPDLNHKLIHATALATTSDVLTDPIFNISTPAIQLIRNVSFYQYIEKCKSEEHENFGGSVTTTTKCEYTPEWSDERVDSSEFKDSNYAQKNVSLANIEPNKIYAQNVSFGAYKLPLFLIKKISNDEKFEVKLPEEVLENLQRQVLETYYIFHPEKKVTKISPLDSKKEETKNVEDKKDKEQANEQKEKQDEQEPKLIHVNYDTIYIGLNPSVPTIGDVKISFERTLPTDVSIIARVSNSTFSRYLAKNGKEFSRLETGDVPFENMIQHAKSENTTITWLLRLAGLILLFIGFNLIFDIISMIFKWFPALGSIVGVSVGLVCGVLALVWGLLVIAFAWLFYRPLISISLVVIAVMAFLYLRKKGATTNNEN